MSSEPNGVDRTSRSGSPLSRSVLEVTSVASLSASAVSPSPTIAAVAALTGLVLLTWSLLGDRPADVDWSHRWAGLLALAVLFLSRITTVGPFAESASRLRPIWIVLLVASVLTGIVLGHRRRPRLFAVALGIGAVVILTTGMTIAEWSSPVGTDVYLIHQEAGDALLEGENPYGSAVRVPSGSPHVSPDAVVEGYTYPPVVLSTYAVAAAGADPRLVSSLAWLALLIWIAIVATRSGPRSNLAFGAFLVLAALPVWPVVWFVAWTEPLSLALILAAALLWRPRPALSAVVLGLALASKQYFVFLAPLVLLHRGEGQLQRAAIAFGTVALTILPALVIDPSAYITATVQNLVDIGFRPDTQSLPGLLTESGIEVHLSPLVWVVVGLAFSATIARSSRTPADFVMSAGLILGFVFLIGQAFPNYWFLIAGMVSIGVSLASAPESPTATSGYSSFAT